MLFTTSHLLLSHLEQCRVAGIVNMSMLCAVYWWVAAGFLGIRVQDFLRKISQCHSELPAWEATCEEESLFVLYFCCFLCDSVCAGRLQGDSSDSSESCYRSLWSVKDDTSSVGDGIDCLLTRTAKQTGYTARCQYIPDHTSLTECK